MEKRIYNFSAGPAILPEEVLKEAQENFEGPVALAEDFMEFSFD